MEALLHAAPAYEPPPPPPPSPPTAAELDDQIGAQVAGHVPLEQLAEPEDAPVLVRAVLDEMAAEDGSTFQPIAALFQDFSVRCRMRGVRAHGLDAVAFRKRFAAALAGLDPEAGDEPTERILTLARSVPEELLAPFLAIARAAVEGEACPDDDALARIYGTSSPGRVRRMLENLEKCGAIVVRTDFGGRRTVAVPHLDASTLAA